MSIDYQIENNKSYKLLISIKSKKSGKQKNNMSEYERICKK
jgi:hypothetical protein